MHCSSVASSPTQADAAEKGENWKPRLLLGSNCTGLRVSAVLGPTRCSEAAAAEAEACIRGGGKPDHGFGEGSS